MKPKDKYSFYSSALETLKQIVFKTVQLTDDEWEAFSSYLSPVEIDKNHFLIREGEIEQYIYYVHSGAIKAYHIRKGEELIVAFGYANTYVSCLSSLISGLPSHYFIESIKPCQLLRISKVDLNRLYDQYKSIERWGRIEAEKVAVGKEYREVAILSYSAEERFNRLWKQSPHVFQIFTQKQLASYLSMSPETFSRLRKKVKL